MTGDGSRRAADIHPGLWLGLPIAGVAACAIAPLLVRDAAQWMAVMKEEFGILQNATVLLLIPAMVVSVLIFLRRRELPKGVGVVMLLGGVAALYFAGEEISWGQHFLGFRSPKVVADLNEQQEFNLHNLRGMEVFNNLPRQIMLGACVVGGGLARVLRKRLAGPEARQSGWYWRIPTWRLVPIAFLAAVSTVPEKLIKLAYRPAYGSYLSLAVMEPGGEFKECCFAGVMLLYLLSIYVRMGRKQPRVG